MSPAHNLVLLRAIGQRLPIKAKGVETVTEYLHLYYGYFCRA